MGWAGAEAYFLKDSTQAELVMSLKKVVGGKRYSSPEVPEKVIESRRSEKANPLSNPRIIKEVRSIIPDNRV
jgi:DNA-binding NarL/FixJ family response regulator